MDTKIIAAELRKIESRNGKLTALSVLKAARPAHHPLHNQFDWDDKLAGHNWRLNQARQLINSVKVVIEVNERKIETVAYIRDPAAAADEQGYRRITAIAGSGDEHSAVLSEFDRAEAHLRRAHSISIVLDFAEEIDSLIGRLVKLSEKVKKRTTAMAEAAE